MNVITANPIILDNVHINTNDMYVALDGSSPKSEIKAFQDWLDAKGLKWVNGSKLNKGRGYGNFGPSTTKAFEKYGQEWLATQTTSGGSTSGSGSTSGGGATSGDAAPAEEKKEEKGIMNKFKALSTTKKVLYIAVPLVLIVTIIAIVKRGKNN
jgi:hypothetical protein